MSSTSVAASAAVSSAVDVSSEHEGASVEWENTAMASSVYGKAIATVQEVLALLTSTRENFPEVTEKYDLNVVAEDDLVFYAKNMLETRELFFESDVPTFIDIGYHYTSSNNLATIRTNGLLTKQERNANDIKPRICGSTFGDGIYTCNNPNAFSKYANHDIGLIVGRLQGKAVRVTRALRNDMNIDDANTIIGDKLLNKCSLDKDGWPMEDTYNEIVLRSSSQCIPLIRYDKSLLQDLQASDCIASLEQSLRIVFSRIFHQGVSCEPMKLPPLITGTCAGRNPLFGMRSTRNSSWKPSQILRYNSPSQLSADIPSSALTDVNCPTSGTDDCAICHSELANDRCVSVSVCDHIFHKQCIEQAFDAKPQCPICRKNVSEPQGKSPSGTMSISFIAKRCAGFNNGTIVISYNIPSGTQRDYHENPGRPHGCKFVKAYVPNNADGQKLLKRLKYAFLHGLVFTVGTSLTTGRADQCTWSVIHHKTSMDGGVAKHGFPDSGYFINCNEELDGLNVPRDDCLDDGGQKGGVSRSSVGTLNGGTSTGNTSFPSNMPVLQWFQVVVPEHVKPGDEFPVDAGGRVVRVRCPMTSKPGQSVQIKVPVEPGNRSLGSVSDPSNPGLNVTKIPNQKLAPGETPAYMVKVPKGIEGGQRFPVTIMGQLLMVTCPSLARPGMFVRIVPPPANVASTAQLQTNKHANSDSPTNSKQSQHNNSVVPQIAKGTAFRIFEVVAPKDLEPGQHFGVAAAGLRLSVPIHSGVSAGQKVRFRLHSLTETKAKLPRLQNGWSRYIVTNNHHFQWSRFKKNGILESCNGFDLQKSAYVTAVEWDVANYNERGNTWVGSIKFINPMETTTETSIELMDSNGRQKSITCSDLLEAQCMSFENKVLWLRKSCKQLFGQESSCASVTLSVRRSKLLEDSVEAVLKMSPEEMRQKWCVNFTGDGKVNHSTGPAAIEEWFSLVISRLFDPDLGLWLKDDDTSMYSIMNAEKMRNHPSNYYRCVGRLMGKAICDGVQIPSARMAKQLYTHILGRPFTFSDLEMIIDKEQYSNVIKLRSMSSEVMESLFLNFTVSQEEDGVRKDTELVPGGNDIFVNKSNLSDFFESYFKYHVFSRYEVQLKELLLGFFELVPEPLLTPFDENELEELVCGVPDIAIEDLKGVTNYCGEFTQDGQDHHVCKWFWEIVIDYDRELKMRLYKWLTGEIRIPDKYNFPRMTLCGVDMNQSGIRYPLADTSFNRVTLPLYKSKDDLDERLRLSLAYFDMFQ